MERAGLSVHTLPQQVGRWLTQNRDQLIAIRRHIHANPELSGNEFRTTELVAARLRKAGLEPRPLPKGNGLICDIGSGKPVVALRADLDALPLQDVKDVPYRSTVPNMCHACGHDVHTTVVLGAGLALARLAGTEQLRGTVRLIFQPAEETVTGALEVIAAGGLDGVDYIFGLHCAPFLPYGVLATRSGNLTAATDVFEIRFRGPAGHTEHGHRGDELIYAAARVVTQAPAELSRLVDVRHGALITFGALSAGVDASSAPAPAVLRGTVRVLDINSWSMLPDLVEKVIRGLVAGTGVEIDLNYKRAVPPVVNDVKAAGIVRRGCALAVDDPQDVVEADISMGGEDFAFYLQHIPGAMLRLGVAPEGRQRTYDLHQSVFDVDEQAIGLGVSAMVHIALTTMAEAGTGAGDVPSPRDEARSSEHVQPSGPGG